MRKPVRTAQEDHMLDGKYLIKKGGSVMISGRVHHGSLAIRWDDLDEFRPIRFVKTPGGKRHNPVAFCGFGGGTMPCPGRHFSTTEIMRLVTLRMPWFDILLANEWCKVWPIPPIDKSFQTLVMDQPGNDIDIKLVLQPRQN